MNKIAELVKINYRRVSMNMVNTNTRISEDFKIEDLNKILSSDEEDLGNEIEEEFFDLEDDIDDDEFEEDFEDDDEFDDLEFDDDDDEFDIDIEDDEFFDDEEE